MIFNGDVGVEPPEGIEQVLDLVLIGRRIDAQMSLFRGRLHQLRISAGQSGCQAIDAREPVACGGSAGKRTGDEGASGGHGRTIITQLPPCRGVAVARGGARESDPIGRG